jgi:signal recognition particle subunit SRP54
MVFVDTAGRLHIDEKMMDEIKNIKEAVNPHEILLVVDAMTGQDAVNVAKAFNDLLDVTGVVMSKLDGDTRGGAALSVKYVTGKPIKFIGTGEKLDAIEPFYPDRMAQRILGMGDVLSLIEKAEAAYDDKQAEELEKKMREQTFDLNDYMEQFDQIKKMGSMEQLLSMIPGLSANLKDVQIDERQLDRMKAIIQSMTPQERRKPELLNASRRKRIAEGSGNTVQSVNQLIKQFEQTKKMMKELTGAKGNKKLRKMFGKNVKF